MGYLAIEIIALLGGAAVLGFILAWAIFGLGRKPAAAAVAQPGLSFTNPKLDADYKAAVDARKKAEARVLELESKESSFTERLQERDTKVAELSHQLDDLAKYRVQAASEKDAKDQRIGALEAQLRQRDADLAQLASAGGGGGASTLELQAQLGDRERQIARLKVENESLQSAASPDAPRVKELQAEIAELRATLVATAGAAPTTASEKDAIIGRLNEEVTGLRAAYEAAEQALEEQDAAIDKLTRELVQHQQRLAAVEGREAPATPRSGSSPRPASSPMLASVPTPAPTPAPAPSPAPATTAQIGANDRTMAVSLGDMIAKVDAGGPPKPVAVPLSALVSKAAGEPPLAVSDTLSESNQPFFGGAASKRAPSVAPPASPPVFTPPTPPPPAPAPMSSAAAVIEADESTVAVSLAQLIEQVDAAPLPPQLAAKATTPPPMQVEANESTVAISLAELIEQVDGPAAAKTPPTPPPMQVEANESTVAISLADLVGQIEGGAKPAAPAVVEANEATVAFVVPTELLDDDDDGPARSDSNDLKRIKGIGKATAKRLRSAGITTWGQVANLTDKDLPAIADLLKVSVDKIKPWVEQAKALRLGS